MPTYDLNRLGNEEFERLVQSLLKVVIGSGTITFGRGRDGGREATFEGSAPYPSPTESWDGYWVFQAKFHDTSLTAPDKARQAVLRDLEDELTKIVRHGGCDNYILATNVPLSAVPGLGTIDKVQNEVAPKYPQIKNIHVWGSDDLCRMLETHRDVRISFLHLITPGDVIAELLAATPQSEAAKTMKLYVSTTHTRDAEAQLDQAGEVGDQPIRLDKIFINTDALPPEPPELEHLRLSEDAISYLAEHGALDDAEEVNDESDLHTIDLLLSNCFPRVVLIGGPGEGKSTIGQYLAQIHRATLLRKSDELARHEFVPVVPRLPFRVQLRDYGQWLTDNGHESEQLEAFLAAEISLLTGRTFMSEDLHRILEIEPVLLILDGLDEVMEQDLRARLLRRLAEFLNRADDVLGANLQIVATSRPTGYSDQFDPRVFLHLTLVRLTPDQVKEYVGKWIDARHLDQSKADRLRRSIDECLADRQIALLTNTPLQVTILILIILSGGTPPRQREALFNEYLEVIYKREKAKSPALIRTESQLLFGLHQYIGYVLHRSAAGSERVSAALTLDEYQSHVRKYLRHNDPYSDDASLTDQVELITREAGERFVLIVEARPGSWGFELRSIQEFFAACHLSDTARDSQQRYDRFEAISSHPHWRNVALFFVGRVGRRFSGEAANVLEVSKSIDREGPDVYTRTGSWLALELASDRAFGPNRRLQRSVIEYGLKLLESQPLMSAATRMVSNLRELPDEDLRDHAIPVLTAMIDVFSSQLLPVPIQVLQGIAPGHPSVTAGLQVVATSDDASLAVDAAAMGLSYRLGPEKVGEWLRVANDRLSVEAFARQFSEFFFVAPGYFARCLDNSHVDEEHLTGILDATFAHWWRFDYERTDDSLPESQNQPLREITVNALTAVRCVKLLSNIAQDVVHARPAARLRRMRLSVRTQRRRQAQREDAIAEIVGDVTDPRHVAEGSDSPTFGFAPTEITVRLSACLWLLHLLIGHVSPETVHSFRLFLIQYGDGKALRDFIQSVAVRTSAPLFIGLGMLTEAEHGPEDDVERFVARFCAPGGDQIWTRAWDHVMENLAARDGERVISLYAFFGAHGVAEQAQADALARELSEQFGLPEARCKYFVPPPLLEHPRDFEPTPSEVQKVSDSIADAINSDRDIGDCGRALTSLSWMKLPFDAQVDAGFRRLITALARALQSSRAKDNASLALARALVKYLSISDETPDEITVALSALAQEGDLELMPILQDEVDAALLRRVIELTKSANLEAARGAALLFVVLGRVVMSLGGDSQTDRYSELGKWDDLRASPDAVLRRAGIMASALNPSDTPATVDGMARAASSSSDSSELLFWNMAIDNAIGRGMNDPEPWISAVTAVLADDGAVSDQVRHVLVRRLRDLEAARTPAIDHLEEHLELPLSE